MKDREKRLSGVYQQLSVQFADLHDTPGRMAATGAVRKVRVVTHSCEQDTPMQSTTQISAITYTLTQFKRNTHLRMYCDAHFTITHCFCCVT
jgi:hypothetical protein